MDRGCDAAEQHDAAAEGRADACGAVVGTVMVNQGKVVVRLSQLIARIWRI